MSEPRTEAGKALGRLAGMRSRVVAIEEQAATEARREVLAKVRAGVEAMRFPDATYVERAAVLRLIEESV